MLFPQTTLWWVCVCFDVVSHLFPFLSQQKERNVQITVSPFFYSIIISLFYIIYDALFVQFCVQFWFLYILISFLWFSFASQPCFLRFWGVFAACLISCSFLPFCVLYADSSGLMSVLIQIASYVLPSFFVFCWCAAYPEVSFSHSRIRNRNMLQSYYEKTGKPVVFPERTTRYILFTKLDLSIFFDGTMPRLPKRQKALVMCHFYPLPSFLLLITP